MANFAVAFDLLKRLEFSSPSDCLHKNKTEGGYTYYGIYQKAHPNWTGWLMVFSTLDAFGGDLKAASERLYGDEWVTRKVLQFYKTNFWDKLKCDQIKSQKVADELFCFGVNVGVAVAAKTAQKLVGVRDDGIIGEQSLQAFNSYDVGLFDIAFDNLEKDYYAQLVEKNPRLKIYEKGWYARAKAV